MFYVYMIFNTFNGKVYIGQSENKNRWKEHQYIAKSPKSKSFRLIHKAIHKYGVSAFQFSIIQYLPSFEEVLKAETYWIDFFQSNARRFPDGLGYNLTDGGEGGSGALWSEEEKASLSAKKKGSKNHRAKLNEQQVVEIKKLLLKGEATRDIGAQYGVSRETIRDIRKGKRWAHVVSDFTEEEINSLIKTPKKRTFSKIGRSNMGIAHRKENLSKETRRKLSESHRGENHKMSKISEETARKIKFLLNSGMKPSKIAEKLKTSYYTVHDIKRGRTWKHVK